MGVARKLVAMHIIYLLITKLLYDMMIRLL